jgi:cytochrome b6-f complex iron-sulfur subunit
VTSAAPTTPRRRFLSWFLGTSLGAMFVAVFYPLARYIIPPDVPEATTSRVVAAHEGDLKPNEGKVFRFGDRPAILVRTQEGRYLAFSATCTHLNCTVQYRPDLKELWCACHNGIYDLRGKNVSGPPPRPLEEYTVNVAGGEIVVTRA